MVIWLKIPDPREEGGLIYPPSLGLDPVGQMNPVQIRVDPLIYEVRADDSEIPEGRISKGFGTEVKVDLRNTAPSRARLGVLSNLSVKEGEVSQVTIGQNTGEKYPESSIAIMPTPIKPEDPVWQRSVVLLTHANILLETPRLDYGISSQRTIGLKALSTGRSDLVLGLGETAPGEVPYFTGVGIAWDFVIDDETYVYLTIDTSGSMDDYIANIEEGLNQAKQKLKQEVYGGSQEKVDKYIKISKISNERWLQWAAEDLRVSPSEPAKFASIHFINESDPVYYTDGARDPAQEPTTAYTEDFNAFVSFFQNAEIYQSQVIAIDGFADFTGQVEDAYQANAPYDSLGVGLKDLGFLSQQVPPGTLNDATYYRNLILNALSSNNLTEDELATLIG